MSDHHENLPSYSHPVSVKLLLTVFFSLIGLTILTVAVSSAGLPAGLGFPAAMLIASLKALLVCAFFMHMWWEKGVNLVIFIAPLFFAALFIGLTLSDANQYQNSIDQYPRDATTLEPSVQPAE